MEYKEQVNELKQLFNQNHTNMIKSQIVSFTNKLFDMMINRERGNETSFDLMYGFYLEKCKEVEKYENNIKKENPSNM